MQCATLRPGCAATRPCPAVGRSPAAAAAVPLRPLGGVPTLNARRSSSLRAASRRPVGARASVQGSQPLAPQRQEQQLDGGVWQRLARHVARWAGAGALALALAFSWAGAAHAARSGGRMGGAAFGGSRYSGLGGAGWGASSATSAWGAGAGSRGAFGASAFGGPRVGAYRGSAGPLTGGFGSGLGGAVGSPGSSVRVNSFFLSPFGFGECLLSLREGRAGWSVGEQGCDRARGCAAAAAAAPCLASCGRVQRRPRARATPSRRALPAAQPR